jgi:hypothetical protein
MKQIDFKEEVKYIKIRIKIRMKTEGWDYD